MARLLQMNPIHQGQEIILARSAALGFDKNAAAAIPTPVAKTRAERRKALDDLESLRRQFWNMPLDELQQRLGTFDCQGFVDLEAAVNRLRVVTEHRGELPALSQKPGFDGEFFSALKEILIRSSRDTAVLREQVLSTFRNRSRRKSGQRMVKLVKAEAPAIYALEADWFDTLSRQKTASRLRLFSNSARVPRQAGAVVSSGYRKYAWFIWIGVVVLGSMMRTITDTSRKTPSYHTTTNYENILRNATKDQEPQVLQIQPQTYPQRQGSRSSFNGEVWKPYKTDTLRPAPGTHVPPMEIQSPFAQPKIFQSNGPGTKSDDRYSR